MLCFVTQILHKADIVFYKKRSLTIKISFIYLFFQTLDLFGKAKKKILKQDEIPDYADQVLSNDRKQNRPEIDWGPQEIGN